MGGNHIPGDCHHGCRRLRGEGAHGVSFAETDDAFICKNPEDDGVSFMQGAVSLGKLVRLSERNGYVGQF